MGRPKRPRYPYPHAFRRANVIHKLRHYLGALKLKNGLLEAYNFGDGRVVFQGMP